MHPRKSYIIYATQRSGSTLLCEALKNTGVAGKPTEYFTPFHALQHAERWRVSLRDKEHWLGDTYLQRVYETGTTPNGVFGLKLLWATFPYFIEQLRKFEGNERSEIFQCLANTFPHHQAIMITRQDKVRQAISWWKATETDIWEKRSDHETRPLKELTFDFQAIEDLRLRIANSEYEMRLYFSMLDIQPFTVFYEDFVDAYERTALRILDYLQIPVPDNLVFGERKMRQQSDELTEEWVQQYYQVKQKE
jgi:trehalose 2-sulfotransferase